MNRTLTTFVVLLAAACRTTASRPDASTSTDASVAGSSGGGTSGVAGGAPDGGGTSGAGGSAPGGDGGGGSDGGAGAAGGGPRALEPLHVSGGDPLQIYWDLEVTGDGLDAIEGRVVTARVGDGPAFRRASVQARIVGGKFSLSLPQTLESSLYKSKLIHFDLDGDGRCGPGDQVWRDQSASPSSPGVALRAFGPDGNGGLREIGTTGGRAFAATQELCDRIERCGPYDANAEGTRPSLDLKIVGAGFAAREGKIVRVLTRAVGTGALHGLGQARVIGGRFVVYVPNGYVRRGEQELLWYVDADGDGKCDASLDAIGFATVGGFDPAGNDSLETSVSGEPATVPADVDVCAAMQSLATLAVTGSGFGAHAGAEIYLFARTTNGATLAAVQGRVSIDGAVSFIQLPGVYERNASQQVLWFVDAAPSLDPFCDPATGDHVGALVTAPGDPAGTGVVDLAFTDNHVASTATHEDVCAVMNGCP